MGLEKILNTNMRKQSDDSMGLPLPATESAPQRLPSSFCAGPSHQSQMQTMAKPSTTYNESEGRGGSGTWVTLEAIYVTKRSDRKLGRTGVVQLGVPGVQVQPGMPCGLI